MGTQPELFPKNLPTSISSSVGSPVKRLVSQVKDLDLTIQEGLFSLKSLGFSKSKDQDTSLWKTSKGFYLTTTEELSKQSSPRLLSWGIASSGKCLTARISAYHKIGKECSLSDILEANVPDKYFLSEKFIQYLKRRVEQTKDGHKPKFLTR